MTSRRIRKLSLSAPNRELVRRGAILVEDAFHTASLPDLGGRLIVVRSLSLGAIRSNQSSAAIALVIEKRLRLLQMSAVYAEDPDAHCCPVVYFHNEAEPYILLALRVARRLNTDAWFWPLALPFFRRGMPADEALRAALYNSVKTEAGTGAIVAIVRALTEQGLVDRLLAALRWQDGPELLRAIDCGKPDGPKTFVDIDSAEPDRNVIPACWHDVLERWIHTWGIDDARSVWLAASLLIAEKPARAFGFDLEFRAQQLITLITRRRAAATRQLERLNRGIEENQAASEHIKENQAVSETIEEDQASSEIVAIEEDQAALETKVIEEYQASSGPVAIKEYQPASETIKEYQPASETAAKVHQPDSTSEIPRSTSDTDLMPARSAPRSQAPPVQTPKPQVREGRDSGSTYPEATTDRTGSSQEAPLMISTASVNNPGAPFFTDHAGMFFLIQVMARLGMPALLNDNPLLIECDLPARLLLHVGARLNIAYNNPMISALTEMCSMEHPELQSFAQPELWKQDICDKGPLLLSRVEASLRERVLFDSSGRLALALWRGAAPNPVRQFVRGGPVTGGAMIKPQTALDLLLDSWLIAMRRWCRRYARIGLYDLVCRPGRVSVTSTHVDTIFDHNQADIRVRKAGLDLDPGWVPWFGRVILFHYRYGEYSDG